ncbi:hypothetical protein BH09MYX1_BH09MYX1_33270 [soil metagenome]
MRFRSGLLVLSAVALFGFHDPGGCGSGGADRAGLNGPCTRTKDCDRELKCFEGVCVPEDAGTPDAARDGAFPDASDASDGGDQ